MPEMTATVRGAGRARHEANRRHQQRTPLPPKPPIAERPELADVKRPPRADHSPKVARYADAARAAGWVVESDVKGVWERVTANGGPTSITLVWKNASYVYEKSELAANGKMRKVRNVSEALKLIG